LTSTNKQQTPLELLTGQRKKQALLRRGQCNHHLLLEIGERRRRPIEGGNSQSTTLIIDLTLHTKANKETTFIIHTTIVSSCLPAPSNSRSGTMS
jgi:hypothetical protein